MFWIVIYSTAALAFVCFGFAMSSGRSGPARIVLVLAGILLLLPVLLFGFVGAMVGGGRMG